MNYKPLLKEYFTHNPDEFNTLYFNKYNSPSTIHFDISINGYNAFLVLNSEISLLIEKIMKCDYDLNNLVLSQENGLKIQNWIQNRCLVEEIIHNNQIEGIISTRKEIQELLQKKERKSYRRFSGLVDQYRYITQQGFTPFHNSIDIRNTYDSLLLEDIKKEDIKNIPDGQLFRKERVQVISSSRPIHEGLVPETNIISTMDLSLTILNDKTIPMFIRIIVFHYFFGYIHPFYDGNGRMARFITSNYLSDIVSKTSALRFSIACKKQQKKYYEAFKVTNDIRNRADLTFFVLSVLEIYYEELMCFKEEMDQRIKEYNYYMEVIKRLNLEKFSKTILFDLLSNDYFGMNQIDIRYLVAEHKKARSTVITHLNHLKDKGFVSFEKSGRTIYYHFKKDAYLSHI